MLYNYLYLIKKFMENSKEKILKILKLESEKVKSEELKGIVDDIKDVASSLLSITPNEEKNPKTINDIIDSEDDLVEDNKEK